MTEMIQNSSKPFSRVTAMEVKVSRVISRTAY